MGFTVTVSESTLKQLEASLGKGQVKRAIFQAVSRTVARGVTIFKKEIGEATPVDKKYIDRRISVSKVKSDDSGNASATITVSGRSIPMIGFGPVASPDGVTVVLTRDGGPITLKHAFFARVGLNGGNHRGVFFRVKGRDSSAGRRDLGPLGVTYGRGGRLTAAGYARHLPIQELAGPSLVTLIGEDKLTVTGERIIIELNQTLQANLQSQMDRFLGQKKGEGVQL